MFGATSSLAAVALKEVIDEVGGEIRVYGTPGEEGGENGSAKGSFVREGFFDDVDIALGVHPSYEHGLTKPSLANDPVDVEFFGRSAHASGAPEKGINALDAIIQVYNASNALRQHLTDIDSGLIEAAQSMGLSPVGIIFRVYLKESIPALARSTTITTISLLGLTAMGGTVGGGGLRFFVIRYGHNRFYQDITYVSVIVILIFVTLIQFIGNIIIKKTSH